MLARLEHRKDANKVVNLVFGASNEEFVAMGEAKANQWAKEINDFCIKKFGKQNILYSVCHNEKKANTEFDKKIKKLEDELNRFAEVDNLKKLSYAELNEVNSYVNSKYSEAIKLRESKSKDELPTPKISNSQQSKPVDKKIKLS